MSFDDWDDDDFDDEERDLYLTKDTKIDNHLFNNSATSYGVQYAFEWLNKDDGNTYWINFADGCYGAMAHLPFNDKAEVKSITVALKRDTKQTETYLNPYWDYLTSNKGPYAELLKNGFEFKKGKSPTIKINLSNSDSCQYLLSFLLNMRLGLDNPGAVQLFYDLLDKDFKEHEAFYTAIYFYRGKEGDIHPGCYNDYYGLSAHKDNDIIAIRDSKPRLDPQYKMTKGYNYVSNIFLTEEDIKTTNHQITASIYKKLGVMEGYHGIFKKAYETDHNKLTIGKCPSFEELVEKKELYV